jgi:DNA-binding NarL/FixJ family response regulator
VIRVVVADDHAIVRAGVRALLAHEEDVVIVGEADTGHAAVEAVLRHTPDVLLIDLTMPDCNGVEAIARVRAAAVATRILVLSMHGSLDYVRPALHAGAHGYVVKGSGLEHLVAALRAVARGEQFLDAKAAAAIASQPARASRSSLDELAQLTPREREVLQLVAEGASTRAIAARLALSQKTVDTHRSSLMKKLDLHNAQAVTLFAMRHGLISSG